MIKDRSKQLLFLFCLPADEIYDYLIRGMHGAVYYGPDSEHEGTNMPEVILLELSEHFLGDEISLGCESDVLAELCWLVSTMLEISVRAPNEARLRFLESHDYFWAIVRRYARLVLVEYDIELQNPSFDFRSVLEAHGYSVEFQPRAIQDSQESEF
ncbi:hypothetical protein [Tahibacter amnicola]|uniref:Uncharacterized protein n=1 Tax=Tahibacter amnicola TaxID=2976241 RepID=A0ABY6BLD8_9GAMM|nr:hypothetical protein [Tahibacter amnicola]UXI70441.1 hypothetical protein N4264_12635 [Tahibacter amnicola]